MRKHLLLLVVAACGAPDTQVLTGQVAQGFPSQITSVSITTTEISSWKGNVVVATAPVAADGTFRVELQTLSGLHFHLIGDGTSRLVFPRNGGGVDRSFAIRESGAAFDLGMIRYVGTSSTTPFIFSMIGGTTGETECKDGHDQNGNMCVDDDDHHEHKCGHKKKHDHEDGNHEDGDHGDGDHEDGDHEHGHHEDGQHEDDDDDGGGMGDAVAEHNFPAGGCSGHHHHHGHHGDDDDDGEGNDD